MKQTDLYDLFIIGGGINGAGIAYDAAGRGLSVCLCEQNDFASATSSWSSKLIHGGLRYLENYEFRLVREALHEREVLLNLAPHLIQPLRIILPHNEHCRPRWMIKLGLFLYDHLDWSQSLPRSSSSRIDSIQPNESLSNTRAAFEYSDAQVDDARLVITNAIGARGLGADLFPRHRVTSIKRAADHWLIRVTDTQQQKKKTFKAKAIVNAAGPWVSQLLETNQIATTKQIRMVKGSHLIVKRRFTHNKGYILQHADKRIVFALPWQHDFTLIGTTDVEYHGDPAQASIDQTEIDYLLNIMNQYFKQPITQEAIVRTFSGVRPLYADQNADPSKVTRDYHLEIEDHDGKLPILSCFGGKLTTYRKLAEHALEKLVPYFPAMQPAWTSATPLPGGDLQQPLPNFIQAMQNHYAQFPKALIARYCHRYGTRIHQVLQQTKSLGKHYGGDLYQIEVDYLVTHEWAQTAEDVLWRRTKQCLYLSEQEQKKFQSIMDEGTPC